MQAKPNLEDLGHLLKEMKNAKTNRETGEELLINIKQL